MLTNIAINYHNFDISQFAASSYLDCLEPCILDMNCYSAVFIDGFCFVKTSDFITSTSYEDCLMNTICQSFSLGIIITKSVNLVLSLTKLTFIIHSHLDPNYSNTSVFLASTGTTYKFKVSLYDGNWTPYSNELTI